MATSSFASTSVYNWQPVTVYQAIQSTIQSEVDQGLWANQVNSDGWCCVATSPPQGANSSWVVYTYQLISDRTQKTTVVWPAGWPPPAENINGQLPSHFFSGPSNSSSGVVSQNTEPLYQVYPSPTTQPVYKSAGTCV